MKRAWIKKTFRRKAKTVKYDSSINPLKRETRYVTAKDLFGGFTELILTQNEEKKLSVLKSHLVGMKINHSPDAFNRTDSIGEILDIKIVVLANGKITPCAIIKFVNKYYNVLRRLEDIRRLSDSKLFQHTRELLDLGIVVKEE